MNLNQLLDQKAVRQYLDYLKKQGDLFSESNFTGNNRQQQSNHHHAERDLGQNNSISQVDHNLSNNFEPNQKTIRSEKTEEATFKLADDIFINSIYHHPCN